MPESPIDRVRPLLRVRQVREFSREPVSEEDLRAIGQAARWSGSSRNRQPWRFIVIRDEPTLRRLWQAGLPQTRALETATAALAIALPADERMTISHAYDDGRVAERILIAASYLGLGAGITWVRGEVRPAIGEILELPPGLFVRTIMALGHPSAGALLPKSPPGQARLPYEELVFEERLPRD
ncbi:MAG: nitroreductase family protein [Chloroflexota bacterium]|nr:nitroreductase family protein [Chloroflexota bacterium]